MRRVGLFLFFFAVFLTNAQTIGYVDGVRITKQMLRPRETTDELVDEVLMYLYGLEKGYLDSIADRVWYKERRILIQYAQNKLFARCNANEGEIYSVYRKWDREVEVYAIDLPSFRVAKKAYREVLKGEPWAKVVNKYSSNVRLRKNGGLWGEIKWSYLPDKITRKAFSMSPGEVSLPFKMKGKWYIIKVAKVKRRDIGEYSYEKNNIKGLIQRQKRAYYSNLYINKLRWALNIKLNRENIKSAIKMMPRGRHKGPYVFPDSMYDVVLARSSLGPFTIKELQRRTGLIEAPINLHNPSYFENYIKWEITLDGIYHLALNHGYNRVLSIYSWIIRNRIGAVRSYIKTAEILTKKIEEDSLLAYYNTHIDDYTDPERRRVFVITMKDKDKLKNLREKIMKGADFSEMAKKYSTHPTRVRGGELGWIDQNRYTEYSKVAFRLKNGEISEVYSPDGKTYAIVYVNGIREKRVYPFKDVRIRVKREYEEYLLDKRIKEITQEMRKKVKIKLLKEAK